jgi:pimeloyl-ACP methyl ester carboxylesterase
MVMLHGAGSHLLSLGYLVRHLPDFRIITMDARWSGLSGDSDHYDWSDLVSDVEAVAAHFALDNPAVVGHSWGGMIAAHYGEAHPDAPGVVNLDGHGSGHPGLYDGMTHGEASDALATIEELSLRSAQPRSGDGDWYAEQRVLAVQAAMAAGLKEHLANEYADRSFVRRAGVWEARPAATMMEGLRGDLGLFDLYRAVACPLLIVLGPHQPTGGPPELAGMAAVMQAYRRGIKKALDALAAEVPTLSVVELPDADHNSLVARHAPEVAATISGFLGAMSDGLSESSAHLRRLAKDEDSPLHPTSLIGEIGAP